MTDLAWSQNWKSPNRTDFLPCNHTKSYTQNWCDSVDNEGIKTQNTVYTQRYIYGGGTDISVHGGGEAHSFFLAAVDSFLQCVDHLFICVDFIIEQHAVVGVSSLPEHTQTHTHTG